MELYNFKVSSIKRVVDGDTVYVMVDLGFYVETLVKLRIQGLDTPEMNSKDLNERANANIMKTAAIELLQGWTKIAEEEGDTTLYVNTNFKKSFDRWVGDIIIMEYEDGELAGSSTFSEVMNRKMQSLLTN